MRLSSYYVVTLGHGIAYYIDFLVQTDTVHVVPHLALFSTDWLRCISWRAYLDMEVAFTSLFDDRFQKSSGAWDAFGGQLEVSLVGHIVLLLRQ